MVEKNTKNKAKAAFEILAKENQSMLMTYLRAVVRDRHVVDDLFQETMLIAWQKLDQYDHARSFGPWLRGIAAKLVMAHFRKAKSDVMMVGGDTLEYLSQQIEHINERPGDTWEDKIAALSHCIEALSEHYRQAIQLRYFEQISVSQIAVKTKITAETIQKRLQRARSELLDCLRRKKVIVETMP